MTGYILPFQIMLLTEYDNRLSNQIILLKDIYNNAILKCMSCNCIGNCIYIIHLKNCTYLSEVISYDVLKKQYEHNIIMKHYKLANIFYDMLNNHLIFMRNREIVNKKRKYDIFNEL